MNDLQDKRILVIDDDPDLLWLVKHIFSQAGSRVYTAADGQTGLRRLHSHQPHLVILDLMMPNLDGWQICDHIRQISSVPLIILSILNHGDNIVRGLQSGADDFVAKPFNRAILLARARVALRQVMASPPPQKEFSYSDGYLVIDLVGQRLLRRGQWLKLRGLEQRLLSYLLQNAGQTLSYQQIVEKLWSREQQANIEDVHNHMLQLRDKLEDDPTCPVYLLTEPGVGYRFEPYIPG